MSWPTSVERRVGIGFEYSTPTSSSAGKATHSGKNLIGLLELIKITSLASLSRYVDQPEH